MASTRSTSLKSDLYGLGVFGVDHGLPGEDHVVRGEGHTVVPLHVLVELEVERQAVLAEAPTTWPGPG